MANQYDVLTVLLKPGLSEDYVIALRSAIELFDGVIDVEGHVEDISQWASKERARHQIAEELWNVLYPPDAK